ncbi:hypothetical protein [Aquipuribacter nitratireducens]|uniref:DUF4352 domain-containing protein n=1 Tax=Aquipuribacter nitratireducens TaxID=650104 RepID=A0ABW0GRP1_9MICO
MRRPSAAALVVLLAPVVAVGASGCSGDTADGPPGSSGTTVATAPAAAGPTLGPAAPAGTAPAPEREALPSGATPPGGTPAGTATRVVPPPAGEGGLEPVPTPTRITLPPAPLERTVETEGEVSVALTSLTAVDVDAIGPGEVAGPGLAVTVEVDNPRAAPLDIDGVAVSLAYAGTEAGAVSGAPADPLTGPVPAGGSARGTYVFVLPEDQRDDVLVRVSLPGSPTVVVFRGDATR